MRPKGLLIAAYVPVHFAIRSGFARSAIAGRAVTRTGNPVPWYTYPAVNYLDGLDVKDARILEIGGGQSTIWWAARAAHVDAVEDSPEWRAHLQETTRSHGNVTVSKDVPAGEYDVVILDGGDDREKSARQIIRMMKPDGLMVIDNSDRSWAWGETLGTFPIVDLLNTMGCSRVDFHGYSPGLRRYSCTSIAFRPECRFLSGLGPPTALTT